MYTQESSAAGSRSGRVAAATVMVPVGLFGTGYGLAWDAGLTGWLLLAVLIGWSGYALVRSAVRLWTGPR